MARYLHWFPMETLQLEGIYLGRKRRKRCQVHGKIHVFISLLNHLEAEGSGPTSNMYEQCMIHGKIHVLATIIKITFLFLPNFKTVKEMCG